MDAKLTSYCGLYCSDCIPSKEELFSSIEKLEELMESLHFEEYANLKSKVYPKLSQYRIFNEVLKEMKLLKCSISCRNGGGKEDCSIRICCKNNDRNGCWECKDRKSCDLLQPLIKVHSNLYYHHDLIRYHGIDDWVRYRKTHYKWQE
ncbi:DUF3795 domain-containing protein [Chloroflexota bacterium]